jgi:hypothetical protein
MSLDYKIGATVGTLATLASLNIDQPQPDPVHYADQAPLGDGNLRGVGWLECQWRFDWIRQDSLRTLLNYCPEPAQSAAVAIKTLKTGGGMGVYTGKMWWPIIEPPLQDDYYEDFVIKFVDLVETVAT